jgi:hypothetical protein
LLFILLWHVVLVTLPAKQHGLIPMTHDL